MVIDQYQIVLVNLDPRPCVIISPVEMNRHLKTVVVAPMTTVSRSYPTRIKVRFDDKNGWIILDQIRTIDRQRIIKTFGKLSPGEIINVKNVIREAYVD